MKLSISFLFLCLFGLGLAQNKVTIFSEDGEPFYLILNGIRQNENPETNVQVQGLTSDYYTAKIIFNNTALPDIDKKFLMTTGEGCKPCDVTYKIKYDKKGEIDLKPFAFSSMAVAPPPPANVQIVQYNTKPMPAPVLGVQVTETTTTTSTSGTSDNVNMGINMGGFNMGVNVNVNDGFGGTSTTQTTTTTTTTYTSQPVQPVVVEESCYPMNEGDFGSLLNSMNAKSFEDSKLTLAKQAAAANCFKASQIKRIMSALNYEDSKLDFAKYAYGYCFDQKNYYQVNDAFTFESSIEELDEYVGGR